MVDDEIQRLVEQWAPERPDLDLEAMATAARLLQLGRLLNEVVGELGAEHGLQPSEGDVLFTLRRSGSPYRLSPSAISDSLLVSSGTLTSRLDRLERKGLVKRVPHPRDRRSVEVELTPRALKLVDEVVTVHVRNEQRILATLSERERASLDRATSKLIARIASGEWRSGESSDAG
jgi:DNA-binding MarR family transcriptional regulator